MIYELFTSGQWFVLTLLGFLALSALWEIILYRISPYDDRDWQRGNEPPPVIGGLAFGFLTVAAIHAIFGITQGLVWLWNN